MAEKRNYNRKPPLPANDFGKLPPQDIEFEKAILSTVINYPDSLGFVLSIIKPQCLYKVAHQKILETLMEMSDQEVPIDNTTLVHALRKNEMIDDVGGPYAIIVLAGEPHSQQNLEYYCYVIFEMYVRRTMIELFSNEINNLYKYDVDIKEIYERVYEELEKIFENFNDKQIKHMKNSVDKAINEIQNYSSGKDISYLRTGFKLLDEHVYLAPKFILGIAASRGAGKTRFLIELMRSIFEINPEDVAALWYSMEDSDTKIIRLFAAKKTGLTEAQMQGKGYKLSNDELKSVTGEINKFSKYDIDFVNEQETISTISRTFNRFIKKREKKVCFLIIDNIMLIDDLYNSPAGSNQIQIEDKVAASIRAIVNNADKKGHKAIVIFLHHMTKEMESKNNFEEAYRPKLSHMKGTTRFADVANGIILLNNPGMHKDLIKKHSSLPDINCINSNGTSMFVKREKLLKNMLIAEVAKNRDGDMSDDYKAVQRWIVDFGTMKFNELNTQK